MSFILWFKDINIEDLSKVGGKNASLGEMTRELKKEGIDIPNGFALTSEAYFYFLEKNNLKSEIRKYLLKLNNNSIRDLNLKSAQIRNLILNVL